MDYRIDLNVPEGGGPFVFEEPIWGLSRAKGVMDRNVNLQGFVPAFVRYGRLAVGRRVSLLGHFVDVGLLKVVVLRFISGLCCYVRLTAFSKRSSVLFVFVVCGDFLALILRRPLMVGRAFKSFS